MFITAVPITKLFAWGGGEMAKFKQHSKKPVQVWSDKYGSYAKTSIYANPSCYDKRTIIIKDLLLLRHLSHRYRPRPQKILARGWPCGEAGRTLLCAIVGPTLVGASHRCAVRIIGARTGRANWQSQTTLP
jgi:hypothetical protein